jgi:NAD(P)-dependent dehydrogenase (short-subunit alcohol dehydrogenase family)
VKPDDVFSLKDRVVVVTGGGTGIGRATALAFAARGARVLICGRRPEALDAVRAEADGDVVAVTADVTRFDDLAAVAGDAVRRWGRLDSWINNAGVMERATLPEADAAHLDRLLDVNVKGVWNGCRAALLHLQQNERGGSIVNVSSYLASRAGASASLPAYCATKGAVSAMTRSLAVRHGPEGIRVNTVCPALVPTELNRDIFEGHGDVEARRRELGERYPLRRVGRPEDVAAAILFLAGDGASWITGQEITVDGGISAQ